METQKIDILTGIVWRTLLILLGVWFLYTIKNILLLFFVALVIVSAADPIVDKMEKRRIPRTVSAAILYLLFFLIIGFLVSLVVPALTEELNQLSKNIPEYYQSLQNVFANLNRAVADYQFEVNLQQFIDNISSSLTSSVSQIFSNAVSFVSGFLKLFVVFSLSFYMLVKEDGIQGFIRSVTPGKHQNYVIDLTSRIQSKMGRWLIGQLMMAVIIFALDYIGLTALGVPYALVLALIGGFLEIIPYLGPIVASIPAALVGLTVSPFVGFMVLVVYFVIQQFENYLIAPLVMRKAVGLNPVVVILSLLIGGQLAGVLGVVLAVPAATAVGVFLKDLLDSKKGKELVGNME